MFGKSFSPMPRNRLYSLLATALAISLAARAQTAPTGTATYVLHNFAQPIGRKTYCLTHTTQTDTYDVRFRFVDRGSPVALRARLATTPVDESLVLSQ